MKNENGIKIEECLTNAFKSKIKQILIDRGHQDCKKGSYNFSTNKTTKTFRIRNGATYEDVLYYYYFNTKLEIIRYADYTALERKLKLSRVLSKEIELPKIERRKRVEREPDVDMKVGDILVMPGGYQTLIIEVISVTAKMFKYKLKSFTFSYEAHRKQIEQQDYDFKVNASDIILRETCEKVYTNKKNNVFVEKFEGVISFSHYSL